MPGRACGPEEGSQASCPDSREGSLTRVVGFDLVGVLAAAAACGERLGTDSGELDEADGAEPEHLEAGPKADEDGDVEPSRCSGLDDLGKPQRDAEVRDGQKHGRDAPLQSFAGVHAVANLVRGHVAGEVVVDGDAGGH